MRIWVRESRVHERGPGRPIMLHSSTSAALVGAAILSTLIFPFVGLALRRGADAEKPADLQPVEG